MEMYIYIYLWGGGEHAPARWWSLILVFAAKEAPGLVGLISIPRRVCVLD